MSLSTSRRDALAALAAHLPIFTAPGFAFGTRVPPKPAGAGFIEAGWFSMSEPARAFVQDAYAYGWAHDFDWSRWAMSDEGQLLLHSPKAMAEASEEDLARVLTVCLCGDRWSEGSLNTDFERGLLTRILERATALLEEETASSPRDDAVVKAVRRILFQLYGLADRGLPEGQIDRIRRETIFFLYEGGDAAKWDLARPHSAAARKLRVGAGGTASLPLGIRKLVTYDHAIPLRCLRDGLREASASDGAMRAFLDRHVRGVVITREEDQQLKARGLRSKMPKGAAGDDLLARYRAAGIPFEEADEAELRGTPTATDCSPTPERASRGDAAEAGDAQPAPSKWDYEPGDLTIIADPEAYAMQRGDGMSEADRRLWASLVAGVEDPTLAAHMREALDEGNEDLLETLLKEIPRA